MNTSHPHPLPKRARRCTLSAVLATFLSLAMALSLAVPLSQAQTSVWKVSDGESTVYLGGTFHLLRVADYPLPAAFESAYNEADEVYFETDLRALLAPPDPALMELMAQRYYSDGRTLQTVLDDEAYEALSAYLDEAGIFIEAVQTTRPGTLTSLLALTELGKLGFTPQGVDMYFNIRTMGDGKPTGELETVEEQINMLVSLGEGYESELVMLTLRDIGRIENMMGTMLSAWRNGDTDALEESFLEEMRAELPEFHNTMFLQRNLRWLPQIEAMFEDPDTEYVLVGAGHMVGQDGLLQLLREKGYTIEQLGG